MRDIGWTLIAALYLFLIFLGGWSALRDPERDYCVDTTIKHCGAKR
jgi:hypothetical protein